MCSQNSRIRSDEVKRVDAGVWEKSESSKKFLSELLIYCEFYELHALLWDTKLCDAWHEAKHFALRNSLQP